MSAHVDGEWRSRAPTQAVFSMLQAGGQRAFFVGGCVRNALMGLAVTDVDIATDAPPARVIELAEAADLRAVPTGLEHGTITVVADGIGHEVTTFRRDAEAFGRHARVIFGTDMAEDAARRDFTMNALYADSQGRVLDPLGGLDDVLARRVRFVGDPRRRITEDYLRVLRFFRFLAQYGDPALGPDPEALAACAGAIEGLAGLSAERITAELRKLLSAREPARAVAVMGQSGVLAAILPGAHPGALAVLEHLEATEPCGWICRLAALGGQTGGLRLTRSEMAALERVLRFAASDATAAELGYRLGSDEGRGTFLLRAAQVSGPFLPPLPEGWRAAIERGANATFPLRAADLPGLVGAELGQALKRAEAIWIAADFRTDRAALIAAALA
jgi:poly(A) polymerase